MALDVWFIVTENFNNREIAGTIWLLAIIMFGLLKTKDVRESLAHLFRAILSPRLLVVFGCLAGCVALLAWIGNSLGFWSSSQAIPTILWYFVGGLPLLLRANDAKEGSRHFLGFAKAAVSGTALLEFIYVARTFSLPVELALTPIVTVVALMAAFSERDPEHARVNTLMNWLLVAVVGTIFWNSISQILEVPDDFFDFETLRAFILPIYLTIGSIPFLYAVHCYTHIETAWIQIDRKTFQSEELKRYAKKRFILTFLVQPWLLRRAIRQFHIMPAKEKRDIEEIIQDIFQYEREKVNIPAVDDKFGWSPYFAREFLSTENLRTPDYHATYADEWWSGLASRELCDPHGFNFVSYSFSGVKGLVQKIKLEGRFLKEFVTEESLKEFSMIVGKLCEKALSDGDDELRNLLQKLDNFKRKHNGTYIRLRRERLPNEGGFELILEFERPVGSD